MSEKVIKPAGIFGDNMVLQRDKTCHIWGEEPLEDNVCCVLTDEDGNNSLYTGKVIDGRFNVEIPAHKAGTGFSIRLSGTGTVELRDVCFGDVYYLAGQSNMELPVGRTLDSTKAEVDASDYPFIRQYRLTPQYRLAEDKEAKLIDNPWTSAVPEQICEMSALGFFCAKNIYDKIKVPIGLILAAQGGACIEAWMSMDTLRNFEDFGDFYKSAKRFFEDGSLQEYLENNQATSELWRRKVTAPESEAMRLNMPADAIEVEVPSLFGKKDGNGFNGSRWFYKEINLNYKPKGVALLYAGELIDSDVTYVNGVEVGRTGYCYPPRKYHFDSSLLHEGKNLIAIRLVVEHSKGGFLSDHNYYLDTGVEKIDIKGTWKMKDELLIDEENIPVFMAQEVPTGLYRSSVIPIKSMALKGILWYQGEANAAKPEGYSEKFRLMVNDWRNVFGQNLPVVAVEMADYTNPFCLENEGWIDIQRQQRLAPSTLELCDVVSAKDLSEPFELHPQRKSELGKRMSEKVISLMYDSLD